MERTKDFLLFVIAGIFIIFRFVIDQTQYELFFVASITVISFLFVVFCVVTDYYDKRIITLDSSGFPKVVAKKQKKKMRIFICLLFVILAGLSILYILKLKTTAFNDVLAIVTLVISIEDSFIVNQLTKQFGKDPSK